MESFNKKCITLTFSNVVENGPSMEMIGSITDYAPFSVADLQRIYDGDSNNKELIHLTLPGIAHDEAALLIVRGFHPSRSLFDELLTLDWDKKAIFRGVVKNKLARHNLCFADFTQEPDYENGKGRVIAFDGELQELRTKVGELTGYVGLKAEGNLYYNTEKTGIKGHGDIERNIVVGVRLGETIPLCFQWYHRSKPVGDKTTTTLNHGDLYIMSKKAVGQDWKKSSLYTLRHSAGCAKYTNVKV